MPPPSGPGSRLQGSPVPPFFPENGPIQAVLFGEAPGPRGADQSGIPFWGDGAGVPLYRALERAGLARIPAAAWEPWDGARFVAEGLRPILQGVVLSNAFPACPTDDGQRFRTPRPAELRSPENVRRLESELAQAEARGARVAITLGRCARQTAGALAEARGWRLEALAHPSSQGLLMSAPGKGKGLRLSDLRAAWEDRLVEILRAL
jgi:uracil-DNA glycosylase